MKSNFKLVQVANWIYSIRTSLKDLRIRIDKETIPKEELIRLLSSQKRQLELIKNILNKETILLGIQPNFLKNLEEIKKQYGIEE